MGREFVFSRHYREDKDIDAYLAKDCVNTGKREKEKEHLKFRRRKKYRKGELIVVYRDYGEYVFVITAFWNQRKKRGEEKKLDFEGKSCGVCDKGVLHKFSEEVSPGVFVDAYKCDYAGHVSYSEKVTKAIEALQMEAAKERHVIRIGNSLAIPIPAEIARHLSLKPREKVFVRSSGSEIIIRPSQA